MWVVGRLLCRSLSPLFYLQQLCKQSVKVLLKTCLSKWLTDRRHLLREASGFGISKNSRKSPLSKPGACNSCACAFSLCREARPRCSRGHRRRSCWGVFREELWLQSVLFAPSVASFQYSMQDAQFGLSLQRAARHRCLHGRRLRPGPSPGLRRSIEQSITDLWFSADPELSGVCIE